MNDIIGMILPFAGDLVPGGYLLCDGTSYPALDYAGLASILGTDATGNFTVPNLIGHAPMGTETVSNPGAATGNENTALTEANIADHSHEFQALLSIDCIVENGSTTDPTSAFPAMLANGYAQWGTTPMGAFNYDLNAAGAGTSPVETIDNRSPFMPMKYLICCEGIYPAAGNSGK